MTEAVLVQDHWTYTAVAVGPGNLQRLHLAHSQCFAGALQHAPSLKEFHGTDMINPKRGSPWLGVDIAVRAKVWVSAVEAMFPSVDQVIHGQIGREQYERLIADYGPAIQGLPAYVQESLRRHDSGLEHVFHVALARMAQKDRIPTVVVQDNGRYSDRFKHQFVDDVPVWQGGIVYGPSERWPGIQLADLLSVAIARGFIVRAKSLAAKPLNPFDIASATIGNIIAGRLIDVLEVPQ
jgi:hypothetical protein